VRRAIVAGMSPLEIWQLPSHAGTVTGFPPAIFVFACEQRKKRQSEEATVAELHQRSFAGMRQ
jgi:hypothetical protein